jgi:hypothetical protein
MSIIIWFINFFLVIMCCNFSWLDHMIWNVRSNSNSRVWYGMDINSRCNISDSGSRRCILNRSLWLNSNSSSRGWVYLLLYYWLCLSNWNWRQLMFMRSCENLWLKSRCGVSDCSRLGHSCNRGNWLSWIWYWWLSSWNYWLTCGFNISRNFILSLLNVLISSGFINIIIQLFNWLWWHNRLSVLLSRFSFNFDSFIFIFISSLNLSLWRFKFTDVLIL